RGPADDHHHAAHRPEPYRTGRDLRHADHPRNHHHRELPVVSRSGRAGAADVAGNADLVRCAGSRGLALDAARACKRPRHHAVLPHLYRGRSARRPRPEGPLMDKVLVVDDLDVTFALHKAEVKAVSDLDFSLSAGETLAVVGESGSGKSQAFLAIMGLLARNGRAGGRAMLGDVNLIGLPPTQLDSYRGREIAMIFQDPMTSL